MIQKGLLRGSLPLKRHISSRTSPLYKTYDDTISNLKIGGHTRVIFQGFTGTAVCLIVPFLTDFINR